MKKITLLALTLFATLTLKQMNGQSFEEGKIIISAGYGFPNWTKLIFKAYESNLNYKTTGFGPSHIKAEYALSDKIGLGVSINYTQYKVEWTYTDLFTSKSYREGFEGNSISALARFNIHFATTDKLDPYWGLGVGYRNNNFKYFTNASSSTPLKINSVVPVGFETTFGLRYYFTENIGAYMEMGIAKSLIQGGIAIKI